ncbi:hypothetical protein ABPG72_010795 [Tetrahymena utriculariae]
MIQSYSTQFSQLKVKIKKKIKKQDVKEQQNLAQKQFKQAQVVDQQMLAFIKQPLKDYLCFFINGDILVEIAKNNYYLYKSQTAQIWNSIKPLIQVNHKLQKNLLHLNFDCTPTFTQLDYQDIIIMVQSMQDKELFKYYLLLENLQRELQIYKKSKIYSCVEGLDKKSLGQYTLSQSIVEVIHGPVENYQKLLKRNGWREHVELEQRRQFSKFQIGQITKSLQQINNKSIKFQDQFKVSPSQLKLKTTDGFDCQMLVEESVIFNILKVILAIINIKTYQIEQRIIDSNKVYRDLSKLQSEQSQTLRQVELYDMSQNEYFLEAEKFVKKYYVS